MEEEDFEKAFEDDIEAVSDCESDVDDYLAQSIEQLKNEIASNISNGCITHSLNHDNELTELIESVKLNTIRLQESSNTATFDGNGKSPAVGVEILLHRSDPTPQSDLLACIDILDEVRDVLFAMVDSVEYIDSLKFVHSQNEEAQNVSLDRTSDLDMHYNAPDEIHAGHPDIAEFEESIAVAVPSEGAGETLLLSDDLMQHETQHQRDMQVRDMPLYMILCLVMYMCTFATHAVGAVRRQLVLEAMELQVQQKAEECQRAVEEDRKRREERRARIAEQARQLAEANKAAVGT